MQETNIGGTSGSEETRDEAGEDADNERDLSSWYGCKHVIRKCLRSGECPQMDDLRYGVYTIIEIAWTLSCGFDESPIDAILMRARVPRWTR